MDADASLAAVFGRAAFLVMDEADRVLEPGFEEELRTILSVSGQLVLQGCGSLHNVFFPRHMVQALPPGDERQTLLFSATMTQALIKLQQSALDDAFVFQVSPGSHTLHCLSALATGALR